MQEKFDFDAALSELHEWTSKTGHTDNCSRTGIRVSAT